MILYLFGSGPALLEGYKFFIKQKLKIIVVYEKKKDLPFFLTNSKNIKKISFLNFKKKIKNYNNNYKDSLIVSLSFPKKIDEEILKTFNYRCFNFHPAKLPNYKGCLPTCWPILNKDKYAYYTLHRMNKKFDDGEIIDQMKVKIKNYYNGNLLYIKMLKVLNKFIKINFYKLISNKAKKKFYKNKTKSNYFSKNIEYNIFKTTLTKKYELQDLIRVFRSETKKNFYIKYKNKNIELLKIKKNKSVIQSNKIILYQKNYVLLNFNNTFYKIIDIKMGNKVINKLTKSVFIKL